MVIFSEYSESYRGESASSHGERVETFDQTVGLLIHDLDILSWFSHLLLKPADLQAESRF
jgi:hypothetical protein